MAVKNIVELRKKKKALKPPNSLETLELLSLALLGCLDDKRKVSIAGVEGTSLSLAESPAGNRSARTVYEILLRIRGLLTNSSSEAELKKAMGPDTFKAFKADVSASIRAMEVIEQGQTVHTTGCMIGVGLGVAAGAYEGGLWILALMGVTLSTPIIFSPLGVLALAVTIGLIAYAVGKYVESRGKATLKETDAPADKFADSDITFADAPTFFKHGHIKSRVSHFVEKKKILDLSEPKKPVSDFSLKTASP